MSEHARLAAADLDHAQQLLARAERAEGEARELREERDAARADNAALWDALDDALMMSQIPQDLWMTEGWGGTFERLNALHDAPHPGAALLPIVTAARAWRDAVLTPGADLVAASQALLDAVEGEGEKA